MEDFGKRIGFFLLMVPVILAVLYYHLDERIIAVAAGILVALVFVGDSEARLTIAPFVFGAIATAVLWGVSSYIARQHGLAFFELGSLEHSSKHIRRLPDYTISAGAFSVTALLAWFSSKLGSRRSGAGT
jgi:hypothetical protein